MSGSSLNSRFIVNDNCANIVAVHLHWLFITWDDSKPINKLLNPNSFLCSFRSVAMHLDSLEDIAISLLFNISRRGIDIQDMSCPICDNAIESTD
ncbi:hypothetical protein Tco_0118812, partial [Tanacetum coccineum]